MMNLNREKREVVSLLKAAEGWQLPTIIPDDYIQSSYDQVGYPKFAPTKSLDRELATNTLTLTSTPDDSERHWQKPWAIAEMLCEFMAAAITLPCFGLELAIGAQVPIEKMAREAGIPIDNVRIRLGTYYQMRFPRPTEEGAALAQVLTAAEKPVIELGARIQRISVENWVEGYRRALTHFMTNPRSPDQGQQLDLDL